MKKEIMMIILNLMPWVMMMLILCIEIKSPTLKHVLALYNILEFLYNMKTWNYAKKWWRPGYNEKENHLVVVVCWYLACNNIFWNRFKLISVYWYIAHPLNGYTPFLLVPVGIFWKVEIFR